jgi:hypothetical protein
MHRPATLHRPATMRLSRPSATTLAADRCPQLLTNEVGGVQVLRERPPVTFGVGDLIAPIPVRLGLRGAPLHDAGRQCPAVVGVDVVHVDVQHAAHTASRKVASGGALFEAKNLRQPGDGRAHIFVDQMRQDAREAGRRTRHARIGWYGGVHGCLLRLPAVSPGWRRGETANGPQANSRWTCAAPLATVLL